MRTEGWGKGRKGVEGTRMETSMGFPIGPLYPRFIINHLSWAPPTLSPLLATVVSWLCRPVLHCNGNLSLCTPFLTVNTNHKTYPSSNQLFISSASSKLSSLFVLLLIALLPLAAPFSYHSAPIEYFFLSLFSFFLSLSLSPWQMGFNKSWQSDEIKGVHPMASCSSSLTVALTYLKQDLNSVAGKCFTNPWTPQCYQNHYYCLTQSYCTK